MIDSHICWTWPYKHFGHQSMNKLFSIFPLFSKNYKAVPIFILMYLYHSARLIV